MTNLIAFDHALHAVAAQAYEALPPACERRIINAVTLVMLDAVTKNDVGYNVRSQTGRDIFYHVNGRCNCPDAKKGAPQVDGQPACKHQIAIWLMLRAEKAERELIEQQEAERRYGYCAGSRHEIYANQVGWYSILDWDEIGQYARQATVAEVEGFKEYFLDKYGDSI